MAKDGTNRGGRRVRAGAKPDALGDKLAKGVSASRLHDPLEDAFDFAGSDVSVKRPGFCSYLFLRGLEHAEEVFTRI